MKYRRLTNEELAELETEFVRFLATNSIPAEDWVKMKKHEPKKVNELIDTFSDMVFENILKRVDYLEHRSPKELRLFKCDATKIYLTGLRIEGISTIDFTENLPAETMINRFKEESSNAILKLYRAEKSYKKERTVELFDMMEKGALISNGTLYNTLNQ